MTNIDSRKIKALVVIQHCSRNLNTDKCYLLYQAIKNKQVWAKLDKHIVWTSKNFKNVFSVLI